MANTNIDGNLNYWYEGEGSTSIGSLTEDLGGQEFWSMGAPVGYLYNVEPTQVQDSYLNTFVVMIGF